GAGDDTYVIDDVAGTAAQRDQVIEAAGAAGGIDTVTGAVNLDLALYANVENVTLTGTANVNATGNTGDNILTGNAGNNALTGGAGTDTAVFTGSVLDHTLTTTNAGVLTITSDADGRDTLTTIEKVQFGATAYTTQLGTAAGTTITGSAGNDLIFGLGGNDTINAGTGDDAIVWRVGDGRDVVNGGANGTVGDAFSITGDNSDEVFSIYSRFEWLKVAGNLASDLNANTDIVITRNGTGTASVVAELDQIEEISINTGGGNDSVLVVGNLTPSDLRFNTITVNSGTGDDT
ncbi:calcium-binding protein, partial [Bosea sp. 2YAB26]|uniref:calcium-binding protein n=1 Tax=Bosea sp. 2YAB26 TaxID=3237478 RepID=UPI003F93F4AD